MTTLEQWKDKLIEILSNTFYSKTEIDNQINTKLNISDAFSGDYNDLINKPKQITVINDENDIVDDGFYIYIDYH